MHILLVNMKVLTVSLLTIIVGCTGYLIHVPDAPATQPSLGPSGWVHLQSLVLPLYENVCEISNNPMICRLSDEFIKKLANDDFMDTEVLTSFRNRKTGKGFLPKGEIFSEYNTAHVEELKLIYDLMYNARNFETFLRVAAWARQNLNCGLFVNAIYMALENRKDTQKLILPPPYEILPNYFIRKDIIIQGSSILAGEEVTPSESVRDEGNSYTLDANYTANFYDNDDESKLAYFREDIGLNSFYYLKMLQCAPWMNKNVNINSRYGENIYQMMKQLVARYNLERYANGMSEEDTLNWDSLPDAPYDPMLVYSNGNEFIHRISPGPMPENDDKSLLETIDNNIVTVASHMRGNGYNKTQILNHLMEILFTSEKSYDTLARRLLGSALNNNGNPSIFEHYLTTLRDPMIWKLFNKMVYLIDKSLEILPPYAKSELYFPGVEVMSVDVKKMMTSFDYFEFDITEALKLGNGDTSFQVKIGQPRLNHKPYTIKFNISSLVTQKGLVKLYIGPKMMPGEFSKKKNSFVLLDLFELNLKKGSNIVTRSSSDMKHFAEDFMSLRTLRKKVSNAQFGLESLPVYTIDSQIGYPQRLTIPRGTPEGLPLQLFVFVAPFMKASFGESYISNNEFNTAILSPLYPLDLAMEDKVLLDLPNALVKDFTITHKGVSKVNNYGTSGTTKSWYSNNSYNADSRPSTYSKRPFDNSQNEQNGYNEKNNSSSYGFADRHMYLVDGLQNDSSFVEEKNNVLFSSANNFSPAPRERLDYKSKKFDYKSLHKDYSKITTDIPVEIKSMSSVIENTSVGESVNPENLEKVIRGTKNFGNIKLSRFSKDDTEQDSHKVPLLKMSKPKPVSYYRY